MSRISAFIILPLLAACAAPPTLAEYRPVVDGAGPMFDHDLAECRLIAAQAEVEYKQRYAKESRGRMVAGMIIDVAPGAAAIGRDWVGSTDAELAHGGPRRIIDRCMDGRGYRVLSDLGKG